MRSRLAGWWSRRELVRSVLSAIILVYLLTSLKAPKQLLGDLNKAQCCFLWTGDAETTEGKCKVGWPLVTKRVQFSGLSILDLERFSRALCLRWLWYAWRNPERPSWIGMQLLVDVLDTSLFAAATQVTVHNGRRASFWTMPL